MRRFLLIISTALLLLLSLATYQVTDAQNVFICRPGQTYTMTGRGPATTAVLLLFDGTAVGGDTTDAQGNYRVQLALGQEAPGDYQIEVQVRGTRQVLATALCRVPGPNEPTDGPANPAQPAASATTTPGVATTATTPSTAAATATAATSTSSATSTIGPTSSPGGPTFTTSPTLTASPSPSSTATNQGGATSTPSATGQRATNTSVASATASASPTVGTTTTDVELSIDVEDNEPIVGDTLLVFGDVTDASGNGIPNVTVTVAFTYSGSSGAWCNATTDDDGYWECENTVSAAMKDKLVTLTGQITINGRTLKQEATMTPGDETT